MIFPGYGRKNIRSAAGALLLALSLASCSGGQAEKAAPPPPEVGYVTVRSETVPLASELAGRVAAYETSEVRPQVSGIVRARLFTEGAMVRAGQTLYEIDPRLYRAAAAQARANLANAEANVAAAEQRAERMAALVGIEAVSRQDAADARAAAGQARAQVAQSRAALDTASINLGFTRVTAPIGGRIGRSIVTTGALVTAGQSQALTTIQRLDPIFVDIQQSSAELLVLRRALMTGGVVPASATVRLKLEDGSDYGLTGRLEFAEVTVDPSTGTVTLRARFPNPQGLLLPGMYVRASVVQGNRREAILVPQPAVSRDPRGQANVYVVGADNKAELRAIETDRALGDAWLVTAGLKPGERVIVEGTAKAKPGQPVRPVPAGSPPSPPPAGGAAAPRTGR
ncbi:efflux transporter periplasmic adaptor subunit [Sphingomonas oleivorans]|uniref:Efflux transporter periplasmic adaptor subunit n=1 Tax=Sphingomonas oleivorans TaxID=1735121 RepID=A0A2T5FXW7_9SPHN|nr:efflux RND transporter periplasmic adaptor subunit [Sphingomonas oleivorans]PTQ10962.1 efflux transporter periplasmic adaptor subunit [Sphingomonas oleivorans]